VRVFKKKAVVWFIKKGFTHVALGECTKKIMEREILKTQNDNS
jgi:hypothetical protein